MQAIQRTEQQIKDMIEQAEKGFNWERETRRWVTAKNRRWIAYLASTVYESPDWDEEE